MKKNITYMILTLLLCLSLSVTVFAQEGFLFDEADLLSAAEEATLEQKLAELSETYQAQILVYTVATTEGGDAEWLLNHLYDSKNFGYGQARDGVLLLLCMDVREYRILSNGYASDAIGGYEIDAIGEAIVSDLSDGNYAAAFTEFADQTAYYLDGYRNGFPFEFGKNLVIAVVVGLLVGLITALVLKGQLKSVSMQNQANVYVRDGSMQVNTRNDLFLYRDVTRTKKESSSSSSSGSGSSRSTGGGKF
jgi:uncharacterized protein